MVDEAAQIAERQKKRVDPMYHDKIDRLLDTYCRKLAANMNHHNEIMARVPSVMIAGPSNFPCGKKEKQNAAMDSNMQEWRDIQGLLDKIRSTGMGGISADDPDAVSKLQAKLANLQESQETMKAVNAYYRKHKTLDGCPSLSPQTIEKLKSDMAQGWHLEDKPFASWALSNNSAEIRRVKARIESLTRKEQTPFVGWEFDGGKVEINREENRLQVFFDGKPDADTRAELKGGGFRWSPSAKAWQRQLTDNAFWAADSIKAIAPLTGEKPTELQRKARRKSPLSGNSWKRPRTPPNNPTKKKAPQGRAGKELTPMEKFSNVDVIAALDAIMRQNTGFNQDQFQHDQQIITGAATSPARDGKTLLWVSAPAGTGCEIEKRPAYPGECGVRKIRRLCRGRPAG